MRKWVMVFLSIMLVVTLSGCGNTDKSSGNNSSGNTAGSSKNITTKDAHVLIAYFTVPEDVKVSENDAVAGASIVVKDEEKMGNTEYVAGVVQETVGGDLFRIETKDAYPLEHDTLVAQAAEEQEKDFRPELSGHVENFEQYDTVILGYPIWWHTTPRVVNTFLEKYNLKGKTVIPFCTSGGSEIDESLPALRKSAKGAVIKEGYTADSGSTAEIRKWLTRIGELGSQSNPSNPQNPTPNASNGKLLVAYFSWSGTSEKIAQNIIAQTGADSFWIERETPYSTDYNTVAYGEAQTEAEPMQGRPSKIPLHL